jgi:cell division septum initiation protein DivIVA
MTQTVKDIKEKEFNEPMVVFPLKQYETLLEYIEDIEDRLAITERINEPDIGQDEVENRFNEKFGNK